MIPLKSMFTIALFSLAVSTTLSADMKMMSVQVRKGHVRAAPSFLSKVIATLYYGNQVLVYEEKNSWVKVGKPRKKYSGWIHASALTRKKIILNPGKKDVEVAASSNELALAGKGFNEDVEAEFKRQHGNIDYRWIDYMEKITISTAKMQAFLRKGKVKPSKGGAL